MDNDQRYQKFKRRVDGVLTILAILLLCAVLVHSQISSARMRETLRQSEQELQRLEAEMERHKEEVRSLHPEEYQ